MSNKAFVTFMCILFSTAFSAAFILALITQDWSNLTPNAWRAGTIALLLAMIAILVNMPIKQKDETPPTETQ